ncbi:MAG: serine protease [Nitrospirae bacterium GWF2_44_13]|nr:MAG: serine protease [Nitrospirae bacterium GWF2_44_13]OGW63451.1 MAG: serine protease [Nitrospirae bacterium RIFOXYA2_FULL_44_9]HBG91980.1 serine protease [Nitrospiraceae bacterium]
MLKRTLAFLTFLSFFLSAPLFSQEQKKDVLVLTVNGIINPASAEYIGKSIKRANEQKAEAVVIELDTPGGLDTSMRDIVKDIIGSEVPVIVYVSPSGARAASAGVFITLAAHVAAMSPGTNIGSAHPVGVGEKMDKVMSEKVTNDAAAYIKSLAERTGRNSKWAEDAVRKSVSATEAEALKEKIIDFVSDDLNILLSTVDGKKVKTVAGERILKIAHVNVVREEMSLRHKILNVITDPNVAYMLMLLGFYGLFFELTNPGSIFPGVMGGICLILAFYAFQTLPVNYAGLLLIILAIILFILEIKIISHGVLTIGGVIAMLLGSLMLFESPGPFMKLSLFLILPAVIVTALFFTVVVGLAYRAYKRKPVTGSEGLVGMGGIANADITKDSGIVLLHGEIWSAYSDETISKGEKIVVEAVSGLKVKVKKMTRGE